MAGPAASHQLHPIAITPAASNVKPDGRVNDIAAGIRIIFSSSGFL